MTRTGTVLRMPQPKKTAATPAGAAAPKRKPAAKRPAAPKTQPKTFTETEAATEAATPSTPEEREDALKQNLAQLRELLAGGLVLTPQRLAETLDEAVTRGRMVRQDAEELTRALMSVGRQQTQDLLGQLEGLVGKAKGPSDEVLQQVDRARRRVGAGPSFPILGYDELAAAQVVKRLADLSPAELRKVRDHEKRHANRVSVLRAVEKQLGS